MRFIQSLVGIIFAIVLAVFCTSNMNDVKITYSPIHDPVTLPVYAVALGGVLLGFLVGAFMMWVNATAKSFVKRREIKSLKKELKSTQKTLDNALINSTESTADKSFDVSLIASNVGAIS